MIIGRKREQKLLEKIYKSSTSEFLVVYGRRRVGKTFLVREFFGNKKCILFHATGLQEGNQKKQLKKFTESISEAFLDNIPLGLTKNWDEAFAILHKQILKHQEKVVIFLDELPWMATPKSGLLQEIDYYWNHYWTKISHVILIVCGSSASWLIKKIIYNKGGLHNRVTCQIRLSAFNLSETRAYLQSKKIKLNDQHILSLYMAIGGIPYYLSYVEPGLTAEQNIQQIIFDKNAPLRDEFNKLFISLFENAAIYIELIRLIAEKKEGIERTELKSIARLSTGGGSLSKRLQDLQEAGFIEEYKSWNRSRGEYYKLMDEFSLFYLHWVEPHKNKRFTQDHWLTQSQRPAYYAWSGYAFEAVCMKHIDQIVHTLKIKVGGTIGSWRFTSKKNTEKGMQIDLIIDRNDHAITLCEIKYTDKPFAIDKFYAEKLKQRADIFTKITHTDKQIFLAIISANGLKKTSYSQEIIDNVVTRDNLFETID